MKKFIQFFLVIVLMTSFLACNSGGVKTASSEAKDAGQVDFDQAYNVNAETSIIEWEGYKPTGQHHGTIKLSSGELKVKDGNLVGGEFVIDMNSIVDLDLEDPEYNAKLVGHLKSADFFEVETYPTAKFVITSVQAVDTVLSKNEKGDFIPTHSITGNLTLKANTKSITFNAMLKLDGDRFEAKTNQFFIDRAEWNVRYGSRKFFDDLKDNFINDEMGIAILLNASSAMTETAGK